MPLVGGILVVIKKFVEPHVEFLGVILLASFGGVWGRGRSRRLRRRDCYSGRRLQARGSDRG